VNRNPVGGYEPGELICVGPRDLRARKPGWNHFQHADGRWYAASKPPYPPEHFPPDLVAVAAIIRHDLPASDTMACGN
jgi:hypothetical protein